MNFPNDQVIDLSLSNLRMAIRNGSTIEKLEPTLSYLDLTVDELLEINRDVDAEAWYNTAKSGDLICVTKTENEQKNLYLLKGEKGENLLRFDLATWWGWLKLTYTYDNIVIVDVKYGRSEQKSES